MSQRSSSTPQSSTHTSFVWDHFLKTEDGKRVQCQVIVPGGGQCGKVLSRDKTSSTKSMNGHLKSQHGLNDPAKKGEHTNIDTFFKTGTSEVRDKLSVENLKTHIAYLIADVDLPFSIVERPAFHNLLKLCNPSTEGMRVKRHAISAQMLKMFEQTQEYITKVELKHADFVSITTDAWTSPNNQAFMAITVHMITEDFVLKDYCIGLPKIQGEHTGANFASILVDYLRKYEITDKLASITADNASTNTTMARTIAAQPDLGFYPDHQLFGCVAHVLNLAARDGLLLFGVVDEPDEQELSMNAMDLANLIQPPDGSTVNLSSITRRIHSLVVYVRSSPQRAQAFAKTVEAMRSLGEETQHCFEDDPQLQNSSLQELINEPEDKDCDPPQTHSSQSTSQQTATSLIIDVKTRWNSTYMMFLRVLRLRTAVEKFSSRPDCKKFALSKIEWDQLEQMCNFLEPLWEATNQMCQTRFPTMHNMIPMYISVMKGSKRIQAMYDHSQLIPAARDMINKLDKYFKKLIRQPAAICATILDPCIKMAYFERETTANFLADYDITPSMLKEAFISKSKKIDLPNESTAASLIDRPKKRSRLEEEIFGNSSPQGSIESELNRYLGEMNEDIDTDILQHWKGRVPAFPILSRMARCYLAIPATSAPSERVFSKAKAVLCPQRNHLACRTVEALVCLKDWYCLFGHLFRAKALPLKILNTPLVID